MTPAEAEVVTDPNLTPDASRLVLYLMSLGDGEHEVPPNRLQLLLRCGGNKPVYAARACAKEAGYLDWRAGGNAHSTRYRLVAPQGNQDADWSPPRATNPDVVEEDGDVLPPSPPVADLAPLADDAAALIEARRERLGEAVPPLVSYLRRRVRPDRHEPYVGWVVGVLDPECMNLSWKDATGMPIPQARRPAIVALAINELATADEKTRTWGEGDVGNLRNKLRGLIALENAPPIQKKAAGADNVGGRERRGKQPMDQQQYTPTTEWKGFNR